MDCFTLTETTLSLRHFDLQPGASLADLRRAYRDLMLVWHPDRLPERLRETATEKAKELNRAYDYLRVYLAEPDRQTSECEDSQRPSGEQFMTVLQVTCGRCTGSGSLATGVSASGHFVMGTCPTCQGIGSLICLAGSRCPTCSGKGRDAKYGTTSRAQYIRENLAALDRASLLYRKRYRRLWVRYETTVTLCKTCSGAGYTFFRPDQRLGDECRRRSARGPDSAGERRSGERRQREAEAV